MYVKIRFIFNMVITRRKVLKLSMIPLTVSTLLQASIDYALIASDLEGKIVLWNEGAFRLYGYQTQEVVGKVNLSRLEKSKGKEKSKILALIPQVLNVNQWEGEIEFASKKG